jgi:galactose mutarotase-like enzyme
MARNGTLEQASATCLEVRQEQGFEVYTLNNSEIEISVVPELGAKIISLKNVRTGREWLWHPPEGLKLFRNQRGDDFSKSPLVGIDECLPTIEPCRWQGRELPDHGELWNAPWSMDGAALKEGILKTRVRLSISPFELERTIELCENEIRINYQLTNHSKVEEHFLWALHPLLRLEAGDELELPASTRALLKEETWADAIVSAIPEKNWAKAFAAPVSEGFAAIKNSKTGDYLGFEWEPAENNTLGLWLTRGGWHGHHHFALEPMNADSDSLLLATEKKRCGVIAGLSSTNWQLRIRA